MNPIKYSELIQNDNQGFKVLLNALKEANSGLESLMSTARSNAETLKKALGEANPANLVGQETIAKLSKEIDELNKKIKELETRLQENKKAQKELNDELRQSTRIKNEEKQALADFNRSVKANIMTAEEETEVMKKATDATKLQELSINQLHFARLKLEQSYRNMKGTLDADKLARQQHAAVIKQLYEQENRLNEAIGKHQMSVGNYAKSWNGLNIAMQQIVRETPNMAMGFNTFMLAISNNIPILADQIQLAKNKYDQDLKDLELMKKQGASIEQITEKQKSMVPVGKQLLSVFTDWQTYLVLAVTLLTVYGGKIIETIQNRKKDARAIEAEKRAQDELNSVMKSALTTTEYLNKAQKDMLKTQEEETTKMQTLYEISQDTARSMEDRLEAALSLNKLYPETFSNYSAEDIALGKAIDKYNQLKDTLLENAKARAYMNKLVELNQQRIDIEAQRDTNQSNYETAKSDYQKELAYQRSQTGVVFAPDAKLAGLGTKVDKAKATLDESIKALADMDAAIAEIYRRIDPKYLDDDKNPGGGSGGKDESVGDYYWQMVEASINSMEDGLEKELQLLRMNFEKTKSELNKERDELLALSKSNDKTIADEAIKQLGYVYGRIEAETDTYNKARGMLLGYYDKNGEEVWDKSESARAAVNAWLTTEKAIWDAEAYSLFEQSKITQDTLNEMLAANNKAYWTRYIQEMRDNGLLTDDGYNNAMAHLLNADKNKQTGSKSQRYKKRSWTSKLLGKAVGVVLNPNSEEYDQDQVNEFELYEQNLRKIMGKAVDYINDVIDAYVELKQAAVDAAQAQVDAAQKVYEAELGAYENGYANNVEYARKELALRKEQLAQAQAEQKKAQQIQNAISATMQAASLAEAIANIFASSTKLANPLVAIPVAIAATTAMMAAFATSKAMASKKASVEYGEGMHEYLDYGGSHASGNDLDFGVGKDGRRRRVERGEMIAVFNKRNTDRYGAEMLGNLVDSINHGTFESDYLGVFGGAKSGSGVIVMNSFPSSVSSDISAIRKSTENQRYSAGNGTIVEKYRNRTRIIHLN